MGEERNVGFAGEAVHPIEDEKWTKLHHELKPGMEAADAEFVLLNVASIISEAKRTEVRGPIPAISFGKRDRL
ncbi:MAG: hypothetical protein QM627_02615 [Luteolibacter sp.]